MSLMTFLLPAESGEKATLAIMVLLSLLILMVSVSEKLPATSKDMPLLSKEDTTRYVLPAPQHPPPPPTYTHTPV